MEQAWYARVDAQGYLACVSARPEEGLAPLALPEGFEWEWMHCYRLAEGMLVMDAQMRAACEAAGGVAGGDVQARLAALEALLPAQAEALGILGVLD